MFNSGAMKTSAAVLQRIDIKAGDVIADIGSGGGFFVFEFAKRTGPEGIVFAADTDASLLKFINEQKHRKRLFNIVTINAAEENPKLLAPCDLIFMRDVFHHLLNPESYFIRLKDSLKPDGKVVIIDWKPEAREGHGTLEQCIKGIMQSAGYSLLESYDFLRDQSFNIFKAAV